MKRRDFVKLWAATLATFSLPLSIPDYVTVPYESYVSAMYWAKPSWSPQISKNMASHSVSLLRSDWLRLSHDAWKRAGHLISYSGSLTGGKNGTQHANKLVSPTFTGTTSEENLHRDYLKRVLGLKPYPAF